MPAEVRHGRKKEAAMVSRIHVYAASLGLLLAAPAIAGDQSSEAIVPDRANTAIPFYEVMGFPITPHQISIVGSAHVEEQSPSPSLTMTGMPASPHQVAVLTPRAAKATPAKATNVGLAAQ
jgi:hypothetical protein